VGVLVLCTSELIDQTDTHAVVSKHVVESEVIGVAVARE